MFAHGYAEQSLGSVSHVTLAFIHRFRLTACRSQAMGYVKAFESGPPDPSSSWAAPKCGTGPTSQLVRSATLHDPLSATAVPTNGTAHTGQLSLVRARSNSQVPLNYRRGPLDLGVRGLVRECQLGVIRSTLSWSRVWLRFFFNDAPRFGCRMRFCMVHLAVRGPWWGIAF